MMKAPQGGMGMMTVKEVSSRTGVSIRTLQYYDKIGLLKATAYTGAGYRLYDERALERLQQILLFRELEFPLKDIRTILETPDFDRGKALRQQIRLLELKKEHIEKLIALARGIESTGESNMDFTAFDKSSMDRYAKEAKAQWGETEAWEQYEKKSRGRSRETEQDLGRGLMAIFAELGRVRKGAADGEDAQALVKKLQNYISANYYHCTDQILLGLGRMYAAGGEFTENIDAAGGEGTAAFVRDAIEVYCG